MRGASAGVDSPLRWFASWAPVLGGLYVARWIHHAVMWLLLGFAVHHVYSAVLMSTVESNATVESIFSGYKFVPEEDLQYSGYRFINRGGEVDE
jgi:Ni,Fe-hydrogenase I cytochrome b subunit